MEVKNFNPKGKEFHFKLNEYSCYKCKCKTCSLEDLSLEDIKKYDLAISIPQESDKEYCIGMAKLFLQGEFKSTLLVSKYACNHYSVQDGQHRICVAAHLIDKNADIELNAIVKYEDLKCYYCGMMEKYDNMSVSITILQKIFKTKLFRDYIDGISTLRRYSILRKL